MMKKILIILPLVLSLAVSCRKVDFVIGDNPFVIEAKNVNARSLIIDVIPENNDFYYCCDVVEVEEYNRFGSEADFIQRVDNVCHEWYDSLVDSKMTVKSFEETMLYRDAIIEPYYGNRETVEPETEYYLFCFPYDQQIKPVEKLCKVKFKTAKEIRSTNTFNVSLEGSIVTVTPSNGDQYLFNFTTGKELKKNYFDDPIYYYNQMLNVYEQYGFIETAVTSGASSDDILDYFASIDKGETIHVMVGGYDHGLTTDISAFEFTYSGPIQ